MHLEAFKFDKNSRRIEEIGYTNASTPSGAQTTKHAYDDADRLIRTVYPDSDDPIDGSGNGSDSTYDRIERQYDANGNLTWLKEQRAGILESTFDTANRLTQIEVTTNPTGAVGETKRTFDYDDLGRLTDAKNDYSHVWRDYDDLSRLVQEKQYIRVDGSGFTNGWVREMWFRYDYNKNSQRTRMRLADPNESDLDFDVHYSYDANSRVDEITGYRFDAPSTLRTFAKYQYFGNRIKYKHLGGTSGPVTLTNSFDTKGRLSGHEWHESGGPSLLVGFEYAYDDVDNPLWEKWLHDKNGSNPRYDSYQYDGKYQLTGVRYRNTTSYDYRSSFTADDTYTYDSNFNRGSSAGSNDGDPFNYYSNTSRNYTANAANEYTAISSATTAHDRAGNMTNVPAIPASVDFAGLQVTGICDWSAFNQLMVLTFSATGHNGSARPRIQFRYDALNRRIARINTDTSNLSTSSNPIHDDSKRYIWDGFSCVEEQLFIGDGGSPTFGSHLLRLERIYVNGARIDEPLHCAIDRNGDRDVADNTNAGGASDDADFWYLTNRLGSIMAIVEIGEIAEDVEARVLEYYKYNVYGQVDVLPIVDVSPADGIEDTPFDLSDNHAAMIAARSSDPTAGRVSRFGNEYFFTARRLDTNTGLYYYRHRYYSWLMGRFASRDPLEYIDGLNLFQYALSNSIRYIDSLGMTIRMMADSDDAKCILAILKSSFLRGDFLGLNIKFETVTIEGWMWDEYRTDVIISAGNEWNFIDLKEKLDACCGEGWAAKIFVDNTEDLTWDIFEEIAVSAIGLFHRNAVLAGRVLDAANGSHKFNRLTQEAAKKGGEIGRNITVFVMLSTITQFMSWKAGAYISKFRKGSINSVFPGQWKDKTLQEIQSAAKAGDATAKTAWKLLTDGRFAK